MHALNVVIEARSNTACLHAHSSWPKEAIYFNSDCSRTDYHSYCSCYWSKIKLSSHAEPLNSTLLLQKIPGDTLR